MSRDANEPVDRVHARALLLDIEGTTTPIDFVVATLFPYARARLSAFVRDRLSREDREQLSAEYAADTDPGKPVWGDSPLAYLLWMMDRDRKSRGLKSIQGQIWEAGYLDGSLRGALFGDVAGAIARWREERGRVYIYSSGSMLAQKLLFRYSEAGDLSAMIDGYFDTEVGPKREAASYQRIVERIGLPAAECLFVSDVPAECEAAMAAGLQVRLSVRPGNPVYVSPLETIRSLDEIV